MKQTKLEIQRALAEDSTVYEYDNIYDDIQQKKAESHASALAGKGEKKPKYIQNILKAAELRKKEQEKRMEKKIQKERELEGGVFDDKEAFVTSAYKKKLQERAEEEEREKREAAIEACLDVTKQKDLSGFYRHLLNQAVGEEEMPKCSLREARIKEEEPSGNSCDSKQISKNLDERTSSPIPLKAEDNPDADSDLEMGTSDEENSAKAHTNSGTGNKRESRQGHSDRSGESSRHHRSRRDSGSSSEERSCHQKVPSSHPEKEEGGGRKERSGQHREKERERRHKHHEKEEHSRPENHHRIREEQDERQRRKDRKERDDYDRDLKAWRDREEMYSEWEQQEKDRHKDRHRDRERDKGPREHKEEKQQQQERKSGSPGPLAKDCHWVPESDGRGENPLNSERSLELKHRTSGVGAEEAEKPPESQSKFAKRSNEETVVSARDRYLARQMARVGTKSYIEKEED
ncbi:nuclear speckle splicing regulatory protein 1 [Zootoca vivipara]|uniref:nuclear speckle splicing regulatory protein 1 n=1 Tax=Zootoca vivipara TaxID=8524 RepID=UPI00293BAB02|nr:nuclear speckle splicing regulatory protein 1 [Zootoca vivipara]